MQLRIAVIVATTRPSRRGWKIAPGLIRQLQPHGNWTMGREAAR